MSHAPQDVRCAFSRVACPPAPPSSRCRPDRRTGHASAARPRPRVPVSGPVRTGVAATTRRCDGRVRSHLVRSRSASAGDAVRAGTPASPPHLCHRHRFERTQEQLQLQLPFLTHSGGPGRQQREGQKVPGVRQHRSPGHLPAIEWPSRCPVHRGPPPAPARPGPELPADTLPRRPDRQSRSAHGRRSRPLDSRRRPCPGEGGRTPPCCPCNREAAGRCRDAPRRSAWTAARRSHHAGFSAAESARGAAEWKKVLRQGGS